MRLRELIEHIRHSLWFVPTAAVLLSAAAAVGMLALSSVVGATGSELPVVFGAGPDGARAMLQAIAGSVITVAGVTFSITIVALQLTSTQFSPRVLRNFLRDRPNQFVLGSFMGTFTYALLVLRSIRSQDEQRGEAFVPGLAITGALVLAFVSIGMLIYFIHHISVRIQVTSIVASVAEDSLGTLKVLASWAERDEERDWQPVGRQDPAAPPPPSGAVPASDEDANVTILRARESGYLQLIDLEALVRAAKDADGSYRVLVSPGSWVQDRAQIASFRREDGPSMELESHESAVDGCLIIGDERSDQQDVAFGIQQLVDIGVKALSPSVNDPTTAMSCIDRLVQVLTAAGLQADPPRTFTDGDGAIRLEVPFPGFDELVPLAFDQVRHYGGDTPAIVIHLARAFTVLISALPPSRHAPLHLQTAHLADAAVGIRHVSDRGRAMAALRPLMPDGSVSDE
ncbi:MAG: DUF2254 domain-containing protein [Chloroflexota bacterium]|nr:DUF2254 domain-containing protein [Chloroflexota bacterium]